MLPQNSSASRLLFAAVVCLFVVHGNVRHVCSTFYSGYVDCDECESLNVDVLDDRSYCITFQPGVVVRVACYDSCTETNKLPEFHSETECNCFIERNTNYSACACDGFCYVPLPLSGEHDEFKPCQFPIDFPGC